MLSAASLRQMHKPRYLPGDGWAEAWGISWCATRQDDAVWIRHSGGVPARQSTVGSRLMPERSESAPSLAIVRICLI